jgi:hypothetical protein
MFKFLLLGSKFTLIKDILFLEINYMLIINQCLSIGGFWMKFHTRWQQKRLMNGLKGFVLWKDGSMLPYLNYRF